MKTNRFRGFLYHLFFIIQVFLFAILNVAWNDYSDYKLSCWIGFNFYKINLKEFLPDEYETTKNVWVLNSIHSIINLPYLGVLIFFVILPVSGYVVAKMLELKLRKQKIKWQLKVLFLILWILKFPVEYDYSNFGAIQRALFAY